MPGDPTRDGPQDCGLGMDPGAQRIPPDGLVNQRRARERLPVLTTAGPDLALGGTPRPSSGASRQRRSVSRRTGTAGGGYVGVVPSTAAPREELLVDLRRARDHMDTHFSEPVDLQQLATIAALSKYYFHRLFTAVYGRTPATYLSERRIERAQDLLRATNLTVTEVCLAVGFSSLGSFSSRFRAVVGETPSQFQRRYGGSAPRIPGCYIFMRGLAELRNASQEKPRTDQSG